MSGLVHRLREPEGVAEGALILNHGRGADENDLFPLLDYLDPDRRLLGVTTGAPLTNVPPGGRHWYLVPKVGYPDRDTFHASYRVPRADQPRQRRPGHLCGLREKRARRA